MQKILYVTDCKGQYCERPREELIYKYVKTASNNNSKILSCPNPDHTGILIHRKTMCKNCGKNEILYRPAGTMKTMCDPCTGKNSLERYLARKAAQEERDRLSGAPESEFNPYRCKHFKTWCGECMMPYFMCKPGLKQLSEREEYSNVG